MKLININENKLRDFKVKLYNLYLHYDETGGNLVSYASGNYNFRFVTLDINIVFCEGIISYLFSGLVNP